jgi:hypothetical protein
MARPQSNSVDYFPHPVTHGKKMFFIREKYGNDGYAIWFMLLEELGKAEYHYLDLSDEIQLMYIHSYFKTTEETLLAIIKDLVKMHVFDKELWENEKILFNQKFNDNVSDAYTKRSNNVATKEDVVRILIEKGRIKPVLRVEKSPVEATIPQVKPIEDDFEFPENTTPAAKPKEADTPSRQTIDKATKIIADFFGILEVQQAKQFMEIGRFVEYLERQGKLKWLADQFTAYTRYKQVKGYKHTWKVFVGTIENGYEDGAWNTENWIVKLEELKSVKKPDEKPVYQRPKVREG